MLWALNSDTIMELQYKYLQKYDCINCKNDKNNKTNNLNSIDTIEFENRNTTV